MRTAQIGQVRVAHVAGVRRRQRGRKGGNMERELEKEEYRNGTPSPFSLSRFFPFSLLLVPRRSRSLFRVN